MTPLPLLLAGVVGSGGVFIHALAKHLRAGKLPVIQLPAIPSPQPLSQPAPASGPELELPMSTLSATLHNFEDMLAGKTDFNGFKAAELDLFKANIASVAAPLRPAAQIALDSFGALASSLVGAGETALGAIVSASSDTQATMVLNAMQVAGIPTQGPLSAAEHAALVTLINGFKAYLDRMHLVRVTAAAPAQQAG